MVNSTKKPFRLNVLGLFNLETENMKTWELLLVLVVVMAFVLTIIVLLKGYSIPVLSIPSIIRKSNKILRFFKSRDP